MQGISGGDAQVRNVRPLAESARPAVRLAWRGLIRVLAGAGPPPGRRPRTRWQRRALAVALAAVTLLLCLASMASLGDGLLLKQLHQTLAGSHQVALRMPISTLFRITAGSVPPTLESVQAVQVLIVLAVVAPVPVSVRYPLLGWRLAWLGLLLIPLLDYRWWGGLPWDPVQLLVLVVALCAAGVRHDRPVVCWLWALTLVPWWLWSSPDGPGLLTAALGSAAFGAIAVAVDGVSSRRRAQQALADQAERVELEEARRAVLEGRARVARELHDVIAHHMSLIAVRAETAPYRLGTLPDPVREEFGWLSGSARETMTDMRRLLAMLRNDHATARTPQPGLSDLPELIDTARQAGMTVQLSAPPRPDLVPFSAGMCAYRIVQEALSNAGRHAAGAPVTVSVRHDAQAVSLQVANGPGAAAAGRLNGHPPGHGLEGMRERAELLGGSLSVGPTPEGGFVVSAVLPLSGAPV